MKHTTLVSRLPSCLLPRNFILLHPPLHPSKPLPFLSLSRFTSAFMTIKIQNLEPTDHFEWKYLIFWFFALIFSCIIFWFNYFPYSEVYHILYTLYSFSCIFCLSQTKSKTKISKPQKKIPKQNNTETPKHTKRHAIHFVLSNTTTTYNGVCLVVWLIYTGCSWKILFSLSHVQ